MNQVTETQGDKSEKSDSISSQAATQTQPTCWKDPFKICKCVKPKQGVFCGRFPLPTD